MKYLALPPLTQSSERENKYTILLLISIFAVLVVVNGFSKGNIVEWSDVEKIVEYDEYAVLGSTVTIDYYIINDRPVDIKVEHSPWFATSFLWSLESNSEKTSAGSPPKYITIPANDRVSCGSETVYMKKTGYVVVQKTGFPDVRIDILEPVTSEDEFNVVIELNKYVFGSKFTAKLIIKNEDSHEITYGRPYFIEKLVEGGWVEVSSIPPNWAWTDERLIIPAGWKTTQVIKVDTLEHGHYRVNKTINLERTQTELAFTLEFDVVGLTTYDNVTLEDEEQLIEIIKVAYDLRIP
jgi:hypothetical protein